MRIHILGTSALGSLLSFHLRRNLPHESPITHIIRPAQAAAPRSRSRSPLDKRKFEAPGPSKTIRVERGGVRDVVSGFEWEVTSWGTSPLEQIVYDEHGSVRRSFSFNELAKKVDTSQLEKFEFMRPLRQSTPAPISVLIMGTKSQAVLPALKSIAHRLNSHSTIVLLQNGMGIYEELVSKIWRNAQMRPHFVLGMSTHRVWERGDWDIVHGMERGEGSVGGEDGGAQLRFGVVPDWRGEHGVDYEKSYHHALANGEENPQLSPRDILAHPTQYSSSQLSPFSQTTDLTRYHSLHYTLSTLLSLSELSPRWMPVNDLNTSLRQRLVAHCIIAPLTALLWCRNGDLFTSNLAVSMAKRICTEAEAVFRADLVANSSGIQKPSITQSAPQLPSALTAQALFAYTTSLARSTASSLSPMAVDVYRGNMTEIKYLNKHLSSLGDRVGVPTPTIKALEEIVGMKRAVASLGSHYLDEYDPFRRELEGGGR
jgi:2-dehydropantoate 2-reductase